MGDSALTPAPPSEVLHRGYGDCKDMAAALVDILHQRGVAASVALVNTGMGEPEDGMPGMGVFDHAIVYVPGAHPTWIDPTSVLGWRR
jgi:transglutaminase-like putative cysteine protease